MEYTKCFSWLQHLTGDKQEFPATLCSKVVQWTVAEYHVFNTIKVRLDFFNNIFVDVILFLCHKIVWKTTFQQWVFGYRFFRMWIRKNSTNRHTINFQFHFVCLKMNSYILFSMKEVIFLLAFGIANNKRNQMDLSFTILFVQAVQINVLIF